MFRRFLGLDRQTPADTRLPVGDDEAPLPGSSAETATARRIVARLDALPPEEARYLACFAYVMSRAAAADLDISDEETALMEQFAIQFGGLDASQAVLVVADGEDPGPRRRRNGGLRRHPRVSEDIDA